MQALEDKIRSLEQFLRARRNQRRGHYGRVMGLGDMSAYGERHSSPFGVDGFARGEIPSRSPLMITYETPQPRIARAILPGSTHKRQRLPHKELSPAELAAMEVGYSLFYYICIFSYMNIISAFRVCYGDRNVGPILPQVYNTSTFLSHLP